MDNRYLVAGGIGALVIAAIAAAVFFMMPKTATTAGGTGDPAFMAALEIKPDDVVMGDPKAPIKLIEYASAGCGHCAAFAIEVMPKVEAEWIESGKVAYVLRDYPLDPVATSASMIARCLPKEQFYPFMDILFRNQATWYSVPPEERREALISVGLRAGLSREKVESCLNDKAVLERITKGHAEAATVLTIEATPTLFINGERISGAVPFSELDAKFKALQPAS